MKGKTSKTTGEFDILPIQQGTTLFRIVGMSPLIFNAVSQKSKNELLLPSGRKNAAARAQSLKHDPIEEYRNSVYRTLGDDPPTRLCFPAAAFKRGMATAALDIPGATKSSVGRLSWAVGDKVAIYGCPELFMAVVRSADMGHTPDIRTRAILPRWACEIRINYVRPQLSEHNVINLLVAAGLLCGIGDGRQEKGALNYGQYRIVEDPKDKEFFEIIKEGRKVQDAALLSPKAYDDDTLSLYSWATEEIARRRKAAGIGEGIAEIEDDENEVARPTPPALAAQTLNGSTKRPRGRPRKDSGLLLR